MTFHPRDRSFLKFRRSRARFVRSLSRQNGESLCSHAGKRQPCQKSPSTNTATFSELKTMSGRPGSDRTWRLNRRPWTRNSLCTNFSSDPSLSFTRFIARERCSGVRWSGIRRSSDVRNGRFVYHNGLGAICHSQVVPLSYIVRDATNEFR